MFCNQSAIRQKQQQPRQPGKRVAGEVCDLRNSKVLKQMELTKYYNDDNHQNNPLEDDMEIEQSSGTGSTTKQAHENVSESEVRGTELNITKKTVPEQQTSWADMVENDTNMEKTTPIQIAIQENGDYSSILQKLRHQFGTDGYEWAQLRRSVPPRITCQTNTIKSQMMDFLKTQGIEFNTLADKTTKRKAYFVRGLIHGGNDANIQLIQDSLAEYHIDGVVSCIRYRTPAMKRNDNASQLYQLVLDSTADDTRLKKIRVIDTFRVNFEKMHNSTIVQCHRCQRFSHTASSCAYQYRCMQCTQYTQPWSGKLPTQDK